MSTLLRAMQTKDSFTENRMVTNSTSMNLCVDLFFQIGAMRGQDKSRLINVFTKAFGENPLNAMRLLFWARDIRGGAGERKIFRDIIEYLAKNRTEVLSKNLHLVSEFGRWDDLLVLVGTPLEAQALGLIAEALKAKNGLAAKWMPRPNVGNHEKKRWATALRKFMGLSPKDYRKFLVENSSTVEQLMCAREFNLIDYSKLPSKAMSDYMKAFKKNDLARFEAYLNSVEKGESKINAGAVYPYDIIKSLKQGNSNGANVQWEALPNYLENNNERFLPVVDVSGSMEALAGKSSNVSCMDVSISLGLYISQRNIGPFKDAFITFSSHPSLQYLKGSLSDRYNQLRNADWGMSTNIESVFNLILDKAKSSKVSEDEMPTMILILSDMEFDSACNYKSTAQEMIERKYAEAGYTMPKIVYWNIQSRGDENKPVQFDKKGTCLVSGFSPALLTNLLAGKEMTPLAMMMSVIGSERYASITV